MKKLFFTFVSCLLFVACGGNIIKNQDSEEALFGNTSDYDCQGAQLWDYPVKPGMDEWKQFQSNDEMVNACQIPKNLFFCLSTEQLAVLVYKYPLLTDIFAFNLLDIGLDKLFGDFNGIRELFEKEDVSSILIKKYVEKINDFSFLNGEVSELEKGQFIISVYSMEILLSCIAQLENESKANLVKALKSLVEGYERECMSPNFKDYNYNFLARTKVISKICKQ